MIKFLTLILICFTSISTLMKLKNGLYYGKTSSFYPQPFVFVQIKDTSVYAEVFYPFKGKITKLISDTLVSTNVSDTVFRGNKSYIYKKNAKLVFKITESKLPYGIKETKIYYRPEKVAELNRFKKLIE